MPRSRGRNGRFHSRNIAKVRRNASRKVRQAGLAVAAGQQSFALLMAVLSQSGGEVTITKGTIDQVGENLPRLGYALVKGAAENEVIVRIVEQETPAGPVVATVQSELTPTEEVPDAVG